jgi:hypothetical protein
MYRGDEESGAGSPSVSFIKPSHPRFFAESILSEAEGLRMTAWVLLDALNIYPTAWPSHGYVGAGLKPAPTSQFSCAPAFFRRAGKKTSVVDDVNRAR